MLKIMLAGQKGVGKDTLCELLQQTSTIPLRRVAFADALKWEVAQMPHSLLSADEMQQALDDKLLQDRTLMGPAWQWWGEFRRRLDRDYWVRLAATRVEMAEEEDCGVVITDCRHHNECAWGNASGFLTVRIEGPDRRAPDGRSTTHASEIHVPELPVQVVVRNDGTLEDLRRVAKVLLLLAESPLKTVAGMPGMSLDAHLVGLWQRTSV